TAYWAQNMAANSKMQSAPAASSSLCVGSIHWPNPEVPMEETVEALDSLLQAGKVRCLGISNFGPTSLGLLKATGYADLFAVNQLPYNLLWRAIEYEVLPATVNMGLGLVAYSSLAQGLLTGVYSKVQEVPNYLKVTRFYDAKHGVAEHGEAGCETEVFAAVEALKEIAAHQKTSLPELAIGWLLAKDEVVSVLSGARTPDEVIQNVHGADAAVRTQVLEEITRLTEKVKEKIGSNPDMWMGAEKSRYGAPRASQ
ncbi:MAG: hypothetical protein CMN78_02235, partial [Spirochaetales bacterium]|nr:hypothetical protein [Spirochaetales bacterium]